ncbi:MAG: anti-sigma factor [Byssovorax sp.]
MSRDEGRELTRREELLLDRALAGLDLDEAAELRALQGDEDDDEAFDRAMAAIDLGCIDEPVEPLPAALRAKIEATALQAIAERAAAAAPDTVAPTAVANDRSAGAAAPAAPPLAEVISLDRLRSAERTRWVGWLVAAASLALALASWLSRPQERAQLPLPPSPPSVVVPPPAPPRPPTIVEQRVALLASGKDAVRVDWTATKDAAAAGASGDVVWSNAQQRGYMRFHGLAANDPGQRQFQLWIFDKSQDERFPIDGGVFDIDAATGDVIVPITAKIRVMKPSLFAVTVEKPGGVVVSKREHIVLTAAMSPG